MRAQLDDVRAELAGARRAAGETEARLTARLAQTSAAAEEAATSASAAASAKDNAVAERERVRDF